jgi:endonuclease I/endonuclease/exonuclease/phosphatase family metal-dependent hydrolase
MVARSLVAPASAALLLAAVSALAQSDPPALRHLVHELQREGHAPLDYGLTDEAMREIHADPADAARIVLFYTGRSQDADLWVSRDNRDGWNREHVWPQSRGMRGHPMRSDLHNLMPTDASVNQNRGSLNFDEGGQPEGEAPDTFLDGDSFEPRDAIKGDVARILFYVDTRYEGGGEPDLRLVRGIAGGGGTTLGDLCVLLQWHLDDPVDDAERARNRAIEAVQGNLNWFIEDDALATQIFGAECPELATATPANAVTTDVFVEPAAALRIGAWNIANLHHESGVALRDGSAARDDVDYDRLAAVAAGLDLDIVFLQEIGSPAAAHRVFPRDAWHVAMSARYAPGAENAVERDIYTAVAFSRERFPDMPTVETFEPLAVPHVGFDRDGTPSKRPTRAGMVVSLTHEGVALKIMGVHLKSSCHGWSLSPVIDENRNTGEPFSSRFDCRTLLAQAAVLENWIEQQAAQGFRAIVLGDFNRRFNAVAEDGTPIDSFWRDLNDGTPNALQLMKGPEGLDTVCWPAHERRFEEHIDFIVYDAALADEMRVLPPRKVSMGHETDPRYADRDRMLLSDHCPVIGSFGG